MIILAVFSGFSSVESEFCIEGKFGIKLFLVSILSCDFYKPQRASILFYKKIVPLNFEFDLLGNEQNFLSIHKAGKLMNVTINKLLQNKQNY